jgi:hypothetical protein
MRITSAGLVGIGTTGPGKTLDVVGTLRSSGEATIGANALTITGAAGAYSFINSTSGYFQISSAGDVLLDSGASSSLTFRRGTTESARIDSSGRLLVGTSTARTNFFNTSYSAQTQLEATSSAGSTAAIVNSEAGGNGGRLILAHQRSGSVGGNTVVNSGDELGRISFQGSDGTEFVNSASIGCEVDGTPGANDMPCRLVFSTTSDNASSPTERMRIDNAGRLLVGKTASGFSNAGIELDPAAGGSGIISATNNNLCIRVNRTGADGEIIQFMNDGTIVGRIEVSGSSTVYSTSSDYRLKENVVPLTGAVDRLQQVPVYRFNFIADPDKTVDGFIAHEAQEIVPECVTGEKDAVDDEGNPVYQGIDQSKLVPLLTAALQEAIAEIGSLKDRVAALEAQ